MLNATSRQQIDLKKAYDIGKMYYKCPHLIWLLLLYV